MTRKHHRTRAQAAAISQNAAQAAILCALMLAALALFIA
jgi:hypothetical protein